MKVELNKNKNGFSLIELIAVMLILAVLALTVLPRFINFQGDAEKVIVLETAASFADAIKLAQAKWYASGKPSSGVISAGDIQIGFGMGFSFNRPVINYPTDIKIGNNGEALITNAQTMTTKECSNLFNRLLTNSPSNTSSYDNPAMLKEKTFLVHHHDAGFSLPPFDKDICIYYLVSSIAEDLPSDLRDTDEQAIGFAYFPSTGKVTAFFKGYQSIIKNDDDNNDGFPPSPSF